MNAIEYLKQHHHNDCIITKEITLAKFSTVNSNYKHTFEIPCNLLNIVYSGRKVLHTIDGDIEVKPGEAFFMTKGELPFKLNSKDIKSTFKFRMNNFLRINKKRK